METSSKFLVCLMTVLAGLIARGGTNTPASSDCYHVIMERNSFALQPPVPSLSSSQSTGAPKEDLFLTGVSGFASNRCAFFMLAKPGGLSSGFALQEGEQNEWLKVRAINFENATVKALLKKPVVRARGVGAEIVFSFQAHGVAPSMMALAPPPPGRQQTMATSEYDSTMTADSNGLSPDPTDEQAAQRKSELNIYGPHGFATIDRSSRP
jgi:hypothetical protein